MKARPRTYATTQKKAAERAATIRRQNVQRHQRAAAVSKLREEIQRHTRRTATRRWSWTGYSRRLSDILGWTDQAFVECRSLKNT